MTKRRTKKNKFRRSKNNDLASSVKWQLGDYDPAANTKPQMAKNADILAQEGSDKNVRKDIMKSLVLVSFILSLELVVYLIWTVF